MRILRLLPIAVLALALFAGSTGSVSGQTIDSDQDGLSDAFEAGFGQDGVTIINPDTGNTATATGSAAAGSTITSGSLAVTLPPWPVGPTGLRITVVTKGEGDGLLTDLEVVGAAPAFATGKDFAIFIGFDETFVCIEDKPGATVTSVIRGSCPAPPADPNECPPGKWGIEIPELLASVVVSTKTPEPECAPAKYKITNQAVSVAVTGLHHSAVALLAPSVGGIAEVLVDGSDSSPRAAEGSGFSGGGYAALATGAAAGAVALAAAGWYAMRRWLR